MLVFTNNAESTVATTILAASPTVVAADGSVFPTTSGSDTFMLTFDDGTNIEICECTSRSGDTLVISRAQESTSARDWVAGTKIYHRVTADTMTQMRNATTNFYDNTTSGLSGSTVQAAIDEVAPAKPVSGTFTPPVTFNGGTTGMVLSVQNGWYERVGGLVMAIIDITFTAKGSSTGALTIGAGEGSLPYNQVHGPGLYTCVVYGDNVTGLNGSMMARGLGTNNGIRVFQPDGSGTGYANVTEANITDTTELSFTFMYRTED